MPTINDLRQQAATIKNATQVGENTATRVGTTFETIADLLEGASVGQGVPSVDLSQLNALRTPADQTTTNPTIYNVTTLHNLSSTTIKVGTLFIFSDGGRAVVTQILLSNYQVDGGGNISSPNTSQITMYYRMFNIVQETWSAWTLYAGGGGGGTIDPYPVSGSDNAVASNGVFEGLQKAAPEVNINDLDDLGDFVDMRTGESSAYTLKYMHTQSSTWLRVGVVMCFANQSQNTLTQIVFSNCVVDGGGNLIPNYATNVMNIYYRFKQFSGNPPEGMAIGVWTTWAKFGDSGYQPDNEDIDLNANDQLQFANKAYDTSAFSGLGRVYLRKNIVTLEGVGKNVLTQAMMNTANTIYHIQYDYDLNGQTITLPAGCVLEFDGGTLSNGWLNGNGITIESHAKCLDNVFFKEGSTFNNSEIRLSWWHKDGEDCANTIEKLNNIYGSAFFFDLYDVKVSHPVTISRRSVSIYGFDVARKSSTFDATIGRMTTISPAANYSSTGYAKNALLYFTSNQATGEIKSINFEGGDNYVVAYGIYATTNYSGIVSNCKFSHLYMAGIFMPSNEQITIENNYASYCGIAFIIGHKDMDESNPYKIVTGGSALVRIKDNYVIFCNCSCIAVIGTDGHITNNCFSHSSIYGLRVQGFQSSIDIFGNYFEGNGKSSFWIDENGLQGATDSNVMCSHLANAHLDEWEKSVQGWGYNVSGLRIRSHVVASGPSGGNLGTTLFIGTNFLSSSSTRTKIEDAGVSTDNQAVGLDCLYILGTCNATIVASNPVTDVNITPKFFICSTCIHDSGGVRAFGELNIVSVPDQYKSRKDWLIGYTAINMKPLNYNPLSKPASINYPDILSHIGRYDNRQQSNIFKKLGAYAEYYGKKDGVIYLSPKGLTVNTYSPNFSFEADYFREGTKVVRIWFWNTGSEPTTITPTIYCGTYGSYPAPIYSIYQKVVAAGAIVSFGWIISPYHIPAEADYLRIDTMYAQATLHAETKFSLPYIQDLDESFTKEYKFVNYDDKLRILSGTTSERPTLAADDAGFEYYDKTLSKKILWNGTAWVNMDGSALS